MNICFTHVLPVFWQAPDHMYGKKKGTRSHQEKSLPTVVVVVKTHQRATGIDLKGVKMSAPSAGFVAVERFLE